MAVALGIGVAVGCGAVVGIGVAVGCGMTVAVGSGVALGCGVAVAVGLGVAVGLSVGAGGAGSWSWSQAASRSMGTMTAASMFSRMVIPTVGYYPFLFRSPILLETQLAWQSGRPSQLNGRWMGVCSGDDNQ